MKILLLLTPLIPFIAATILCFPAKLIKKFSGIISSLSVFISLILIIIIYGSKEKIELFWFSSGGINLTLSLTSNNFEWLIALEVAVIGFLVILYSIKFIEERKEFYFRVISFFIGSMLLLVLSDSFISTFIAWEFVGISSFLLIGFWFNKYNSIEAARKALLMTRIGDFGFLLAMLIIIVSSGSSDIQTFINSIHTFDKNILTILSLLFLTAALGKSAQLPFTSWLPDAMAGPAPVSALIHSATMVAAGVFLLLKLFPLYEIVPEILNLILWIGGITALTAGLIATTRFDIKRILAWSTISQLGEMYLAIGLTGALAATFHLSTHAIFKASLFLTAGVIGHAAGSRDIRKLGNLYKKIPVTAYVFFASALALSGFPLLAGFWSEEEILASALIHNPIIAVLMLLLIFIAGVYISRAGYSIFFNHKESENPEADEKSITILIPMIILGLLSIIIGWFFKQNIEFLLDFSLAPKIGWSWKIAAILSSILGLLFGAYRVKNYGSVPAFGNIFSKLKIVVEGFVLIPVKVFSFLSSVINNTEILFDQTAKKLSFMIIYMSKANELVESYFDKGARLTENYVLKSSNKTDAVENKGFSDMIDEFAKSFSLAGKVMRKAQTGKIFLYTIVLFSWIVITIVGVLLFAL